MRTTSSKASKHAHASRYANEIRAGQPSYSDESEIAKPRRSRRSRRARLFKIMMLPTAALLVTLVLAAAHFAGSKNRAAMPTGNLPGWHLVYSQDLDRKSTRLNSSHLGISYAVF